jgi:hypothetical protein
VCLSQLSQPQWKVELLKKKDKKKKKEKTQPFSLIFSVLFFVFSFYVVCYCALDWDGMGRMEGKG